MRHTRITFLNKFAIVLCSILILSNTHRISLAAEMELSRDWLGHFYQAYSVFDGSHLDYYADDAVLVDETAGIRMHGKAQLQGLYEQAKATYTKLEWVIEERVLDGRRVAVRGRVKGVALQQEFDVAFTTWLELTDGKIVRQVDFVDYATLRKQLTPRDNSDST